MTVGKFLDLCENRFSQICFWTTNRDGGSIEIGLKNPKEFYNDELSWLEIDWEEQELSMGVYGEGSESYIADMRAMIADALYDEERDRRLVL